MRQRCKSAHRACSSSYVSLGMKTLSFWGGYLQTREVDIHREQGSSPEHLTRLILQALHLSWLVRTIYPEMARKAMNHACGALFRSLVGTFRRRGFGGSRMSPVSDGLDSSLVDIVKLS